LNEVELPASMWVENSDLTERLSALKVASWASLMGEKFPGILSR